MVARRAGDPHLRPTPDTAYRLVARAPADAPRPVVIGAGPCGLFAGLILAEMGFAPIIIDRGKAVLAVGVVTTAVAVGRQTESAD